MLLALIIGAILFGGPIMLVVGEVQAIKRYGIKETFFLLLSAIWNILFVGNLLLGYIATIGNM